MNIFLFKISPKRGFLTMYLKFNEHILLIINTHLEAGSSSQSLDGLPLRNEQLKEIMEYVNNVNKPVILCGDFNTESTNNIQYSLIRETLNGFTDSMTKRVSTADKNESIDYIFHSQHLKCIDTTVYPSLDNLLNHKETDKDKTYFSDHAIISATFEY